MAVTDERPGPADPLAALLLAALALPGLALQPALAEDGGTAAFQYSRYQEGGRDLDGLNSKFRPITAESVRQSLSLPLRDGWQGRVNVSQDSWSGATPVATVPSSARGNRVNTTHVMTGASIDGVTHDHGVDEDGNPLPAEVHVSSGASPYLYSALKLDARYRPLQTDADGQVSGGVDDRLVHTLSSASPEVRQQIDISATRERGERAYTAAGGLSREPDFESWFGQAAVRHAVNRRLTTLNAGISYTQGKTDARLDPDVTPHVYEPYMYLYERPGSEAVYNAVRRNSRMSPGAGAPVIRGTRTDWAAGLGVTHILSKTAWLDAGLGYTRSHGYLDNPYKAVEVAFIDPQKQQGRAGGNAAAGYEYDAEVVALMEKRPDLRQQGTLNLRLVRHVARPDAALHLDYRYFQDSWGVRAHTLQGQWVQPLGGGWSLTPRLRYYTQTAADFYTPYLITAQGLYNVVTDPVYGVLYRNTALPDDSRRYYEDPAGTVPPPLDPDPASARYGLPVTGANGRAVINRDTGQAVDSAALVRALKPDTTPFDRSVLPATYSSDPRLSGFGNVTAGLVLTRQWSQGLRLEVGYERMRHAGSLKPGGGEAAYADYTADWFNVALTVDLDAVAATAGGGEHAHHPHSAASAAATGAPAGVLMDHLPATAGEFMVGYRYQAVRQSGAVTDGHGAVDDYTLINRGCGGLPCYVRPTQMDMRMHMLDVMYAWSDRLTLMLMPQFMTMDMSMRLLDGSPRTGGMDATGMAITHAAHPHVSAGLGDTEVHALLRLGDAGPVSWHAGLGLSLPTGAVDLGMRSMMGVDMGRLAYGMQLGSGTWDVKPGLTVTGRRDALAWGAQLSGIRRLQSRNDAGYALGDVIQTTVWGSRAWRRPDLSASLRAAYTRQGAIRGAFRDRHVPISSDDNPGNSGGQWLDLGLGMNHDIRQGMLAGNRLGVEWMQPVRDTPNGYQLRRSGTLTLNWAMHL